MKKACLICRSGLLGDHHESMKQNKEKRRMKEKQVVTLMIRLYCRKHHGTRNMLCPACAALADYACERSDKCPFMETKSFCSNCRVHCYEPEMRNRIRQVMRFSGPRMILYHPILALRHLISTKREARRLKRQGG